MALALLLVVPRRVALAERDSQKILVVDDDDAIRAMVERVLRRENYAVESARDGQEAIERLERSDYQTILLDLMMPRVDGLGVIRYLETNRPETTRSVIVMTANLHGASDAAVAGPVFNVIPKPFDIRTLIEQVRACQDGGSRPARELPDSEFVA
jgi:DNA-binding response OmpR family regulator